MSNRRYEYDRSQLAANSLDLVARESGVLGRPSSAVWSHVDRRWPVATITDAYMREMLTKSRGYVAVIIKAGPGYHRHLRRRRRQGPAGHGRRPGRAGRRVHLRGPSLPQLPGRRAGGLTAPRRSRAGTTLTGASGQADTQRCCFSGLSTISSLTRRSPWPIWVGLSRSTHVMCGNTRRMTSPRGCSTTLTRSPTPLALTSR